MPGGERAQWMDEGHSFNDLIKLQGFVHGTNVYLFNNDKLLRNGYSLNQLFSHHRDVHYL